MVEQGKGGVGDCGGGSGLSEAAIQDSIAGTDCLLRFKLKDEETIFYEQVFKTGQTFEWVKHKVALQLEAKYQDLLLFKGGKRIPEPFCLVDMGIQTGQEIEVHIAEGAEIGLDKLREQVQKELAEAAAQEDDELNGGTGES